MNQGTEERLKEYSWHDCPVYSFKFDDNFSLDIDYILEWKLEKGNSYKYLIAPASLEFIEVTALKINIETSFVNGFEIDRIEYSNGTWGIYLQEGKIEFKAKDFLQKIRKDPIWKTNQFLSEIERN
ncbi:hypothetical protein [Parapedobacter koreensis]|uniref:Uncharacterized protein n=1 Tax=Parapedobacter koreensis TaxID=332977 RepID=A0A1H7UEP0_9SPHI|nr:hypothetical protein [Parapedobacter koreensis]SEL95493.1 hypothetical protein SAMN05421740_11529 [Parapedobacter koreensis]